MSLVDKLVKNSTSKLSSQLDTSIFFTKKDKISTPVPMINVALSGDIHGGITPGLTTIAGKSKHFKTGFSLLLASTYLNNYPESALLFYDSEFGSPQSYFKAFNIPLNRVIHTPISDVEELKHDLSVQLNNLDRNDKVFILVDSIGNLASKKETDDALDGKVVADMSRAKAIKSLFRIVTPKLTIKNIPMVVINHTYQELGMFPKDVVGGGTGSYYSSDNIWIVGRQQDKDGTEIQGYHFVINVEKSRYVKEKSKIPITVSYENGINKWSGMFDLAIEFGILSKTKPGWYARVNSETGEVGNNMRAGDIVDNTEFWEDILKTTKFADWISKKYSISHDTAILGDDENVDC
jgi:RecA/RadA recombinase